MKDKPQTELPKAFPAHFMDQRSMVDLHGLSPAQSKVAVNRHLSYFNEGNITAYRFVTGRGNHKNKKGEKGTLHKQFPEWISEKNHEQIASITKGEGYYEVNMKPPPKKGAMANFLGEWVKEDLASQLEEIKKLALKGESEAQYLLGHCYQHGIGIDKNERKAVEWYKESVVRGNAFGQYALGACYWQGEGVKQNDQEAIRLFEASAAQDFALAVHQLGDVYYYGWGVKEDTEKAVSYYQKAADLSLDIAKRKLAHAYRLGEGIKENKKKAFNLYKEVADNGDPHAAYNVACAYLYAEGTEKDIDLAFKYGKQAADRNDPDAQYMMYQFYHEGLGVTPDKKISLAYLKQAAENQHKHALLQLAYHPGISQGELKLDYLIKAARAGQIAAQAIVLSKFSSTLLTEVGLPEAEQKLLSEKFWHQPDEALLSLPESNFKWITLDAYLKNGNLTKKRKQKVINLLYVLAEQGYPQALGRLGTLYMQGEIIKKDLQKAKECWEKGAALGSHDCMCCLGHYYEEKELFNVEKALYYHHKAAEQGSANSHNKLGIFYRNGEMVECNFEKAHYHFEEAMRLDNDEEKHKLTDGLFYKSVYPYAAYNMGVLYWILFRNNEEKDALTMAIYWF